MKKLINSIAAVLVTIAVSHAGVVAAGARDDGSAKQSKVNKAARKNQKEAIKEDVKGDKRDLKQDQAELNRLRADLKAAEQTGDRSRAARDRDAIRNLEADMRGDRVEVAQDKADAKAIGKGPKKNK